MRSSVLALRRKRSKLGGTGWGELHKDILLMIFKRIDHKRLLKTAYSVCRSWRSACYHELFWKEPNTIYFVTLKDICVPYETYFGLKLMKLLVNILDGLLQDKFESVTNIVFPARLFLSDSHLCYIAERLPKLCEICFPYTLDMITGAGFSRALRYWSELKILHLGPIHFSENSHIIQELGINCKNLEKFCIYNMDMYKNKHVGPFILDEYISLVMANNLGKLQTLVLDCCMVFKLGLHNILSRFEDVEVILSSCLIVTRIGRGKTASRGGKHYSYSIKKITNTTMYCLMNGNAAKMEFISLKSMLNYIWKYEENPTLPTDEKARAKRKRAQKEIQSMVADYHSCQH